MNRTDFFFALIGLSLLAAGCEKGSTAVIAPASVPSDAGARSAVIAEAQKQYLSIEAVAVSQVVDLLALPGRVTFRPQAQSAIGATTAGRVVAVLVQAGQVVKTGTELLTIESADAGTARATLDQAATRLGSAESVFRRQVEMVEKGVGLEFERQEAEARLKEAGADLPALAARVAARVENFNPRVDPESRRGQVYLAITKRIDGLRAGMLAQVALRVGAKADVLVPVSAVLIKDGKRRVVYVEREDGSFEARDVETGRNQDGRVVILQGLTAGERVVVRGALLLDTQAEQLL